MIDSWLPPESVVRERKEDRGGGERESERGMECKREEEGKASKTEAAGSFMAESQKWHTPISAIFHSSHGHVWKRKRTRHRVCAPGGESWGPSWREATTAPRRVWNQERGGEGKNAIRS